MNEEGWNEDALAWYLPSHEAGEKRYCDANVKNEPFNGQHTQYLDCCLAHCIVFILAHCHIL